MPYCFRRAALQRLARLVDLWIVGSALLLGIIASAGSSTWPSIENLLIVRVKLANLLLLAAYFAFCSLVFSMHGFYRSRPVIRWPQRLAKTIGAVTVIVATVYLSRDRLDFAFATNEFLVFFFLLCASMMIVVHELSRILQTIARLQGKDFRNVVIIADDQRGVSLAARLEQQSNLGYRVLRIITTKEPEG